MLTGCNITSPTSKHYPNRSSHGDFHKLARKNFEAREMSMYAAPRTFASGQSSDFKHVGSLWSGLSRLSPTQVKTR